MKLPFRPFLLVAALVLAVIPRAAQADILYDANSAGVFSNSTGGPGQHYMQQVTLAGGTSYTINSLPVLGIRWNDITAGSQGLILNFYSGVDLTGGSTDALAAATLFEQRAFGLPAPGVNGSYNYTLPFSTPILTTGTFTLEIVLTNATLDAYATGVAYRLSTSAPTVGSNLGFTWIDGNGDGIFSGSEQVFSSGGSSVLNIRMTIDGVAVPEPSTTAFALIGGLGAFIAVRRRVKNGQA